VDREVVGRSVGASDTLDPAVGGQDLSVPAVGGVVGHLVRHVLTESETSRVDADGGEEEVDSGDEVAEGLVVDDLLQQSVGPKEYMRRCFSSRSPSGSTLDGRWQRGRASHLLNGLPDAHLRQFRLPLDLDVLVEQHELDVLDLVEPGVALVLRVDKVLDLGHGELSDSKETLLGRDLVSEGATDLGGRKGDSAVVEVEETGKVDKVALGGFGSEVTEEQEESRRDKQGNVEGR
jgi:hypothetical protein